MRLLRTNAHYMRQKCVTFYAHFDAHYRIGATRVPWVHHGKFSVKPTVIHHSAGAVTVRDRWPLILNQVRRACQGMCKCQHKTPLLLAQRGGSVRAVVFGQGVSVKVQYNWSNTVQSLNNQSNQSIRGIDHQNSVRWVTGCETSMRKEAVIFGSKFDFLIKNQKFKFSIKN